MLAALLIVSLLLVLQTGCGLYYRRQIRDVGRQLDFIGKHDSFKLITTQLQSRELSRLVESCNELLRERRAQNQRFIQKNEEIHETIASLSHDIRTPLAALDGYLQLAERAEPVPERAEQSSHRADYVRLARSRIKGMSKLIEELFLYTKLQNPDYRLELSTVDAAELLRHSLVVQLEPIAATGYEPDLALPSQALVVGQAHAIERVFGNVLSNYVHHGEGRLTIHSRETESEWEFMFANPLPPGRTIDAERLFQRFYKADPARSEQTSGLGLTIVQSLVQKMKGSVRAEQHDQQFCLWIRWPKKREERV
jgi:signal transduction histidine kinase